MFPEFNFNEDFFMIRSWNHHGDRTIVTAAAEDIRLNQHREAESWNEESRSMN